MFQNCVGESFVQLQCGRPKKKKRKIDTEKEKKNHKCVFSCIMLAVFYYFEFSVKKAL